MYSDVVTAAHIVVPRWAWAMSRLGKPTELDLLGSALHVSPDRAQYQEEVAYTQDGRAYTVPRCGRFTPVRFQLEDGRTFFGRYTADGLQVLECGLGVRVTLVELPDSGEVLPRRPNTIVQLHLPASRAAARP